MDNRLTREDDADGKIEGERIGREMGEKLGKQLGEIIVKGLEDEYKKGYEQAEKDTIARAVKWLTIYQGKDLDYLTGESIELFKEAMKKED